MPLETEITNLKSNSYLELRRKSKVPGFRCARSLAALTVMTFPLLAFAADDSIMNLKKKIQEIEARLQKLEEAQSRKPQEEAGATARAQDPRSIELQELTRQVEVLAREVEKLRSGEPETEVSDEKAKNLGLGSSAASIYRKKQGVSIAGYGEMTYENFADRNESGSPIRRASQLDFLRGILYAGYRFSDKFVFNSEIEFEHASTGRNGEASLEFAYLDYLASNHLTLRGGLLLVPMGLTNEFHEPNAFLGVRRSETETRIIPSTWRENGFGVLGSAGMLQYRAYVVNGLDASGFSSDGIRGGRQGGSRAKASNLAFVGRLDLTPTPGVFFGGSLYSGGSGQGQFVIGGREFKAQTTIGELHAQLQVRGFDVRGLYARAVLDDVAELNQARNLSGSSTIGQTLQGGYIQFGYNVFSQFSESTRLTPYYRFEKLNPQAEVPPGFSFEPALDRKFHTLGLEFRPIHNITIKSDYQWLRNAARSGLNQFNVGLGYAF